MYIVIEKHGGPEYAAICTDTEGNNLVFDSYEEAEQEKNECQDGIIVDLKLDCRIKEVAQRLIDELYKVYGASIEWDEVKELEKYL